MTVRRRRRFREAGRPYAMLSLDTIRAARERLKGHVHLTPMLSATRLGERVGVHLFLKCESLQKTGSFKVRGALNKLACLDAAARAHGVVTVSAGNHAQALAWASRTAGVHCVVVMPEAASRAKVDASRGYGAEVVLHGATSKEAFAHAHELSERRGLIFVHPFDDSDICAGAGTVGLEILEQLHDVNAVVVPIGGGGLVAGIATAIRQARPGVRIFGVEPTGAAAMRRSLDEGRPVHLDRVQTVADGLGAPMAGELPFRVVRSYVDDVVLVSDDEIAAAVRDLLVSTKLLAEGAGAAATAAVLAGRLPLERGSRVVSIVSGGNVDLATLKALL